jgi:hypothetical protein
MRAESDNSDPGSSRRDTNHTFEWIRQRWKDIGEELRGLSGTPGKVNVNGEIPTDAPLRSVKSNVTEADEAEVFAIAIPV